MTTLNMAMIMTLVLAVVIFSRAAAAPVCEIGANIGTRAGVQIEAINGSRVEMGPLRGQNIIKAGSTISVSFRPQSTTGLIFAALGELSNDMVAAYIHNGRLAFARRCRKFHYVGIGKRLVYNRWYTLKYHHSRRGGLMLVDGSNHYRQYPMWGCQSLTELYFGGLPAQLSHKVYWKESGSHFYGCIRQAELDGTFPSDVTPRYSVISTCRHSPRDHFTTNRPSKGYK